MRWTYQPALLFTIALAGIPAAQAVVPYPDYNVYQAQAYEKHATECFVRVGLELECARLLETSLRFNPGRASSHLALGWYYLRTGDSTRAQPEFADALRLDATLSDALKGMGDVYAAQGKLTLAEERYQQYLKAAPKDPMAYYNLAAISALKGDDVLALERLRTAIEHGFSDFALIDLDARWARLKGDTRLKALRPEAPGKKAAGQQ